MGKEYLSLKLQTKITLIMKDNLAKTNLKEKVSYGTKIAEHMTDSSKIAKSIELV